MPTSMRHVFFITEDVEDLNIILSEVESWLISEASLELIWDEGCPHDGWLEWLLPPHMTELNNWSVTLRQFLTELRKIQSLLAAEKKALSLLAST